MGTAGNIQFLCCMLILIAALEVFDEKQLLQMQKDLAEPKATKTAVARKWGIAATTLTRKLEEFSQNQAKAEERKAAKKHTRLTQDEKDHIIRLYVTDGWTMNAIAKLIQRSAGAVKRALENAGIPVRGRGMKKEQPVTVGDSILVNAPALDASIPICAAVTPSPVIEPFEVKSNTQPIPTTVIPDAIAPRTISSSMVTCQPPVTSKSIAVVIFEFVSILIFLKASINA